jgi:hypothetical protein
MLAKIVELKLKLRGKSLFSSGDERFKYLLPLIAGTLFAALYAAFYVSLGFWRPLGKLCLTRPTALALRSEMLWGASGAALSTALIFHQLIAIHIISNFLSRASAKTRSTIWRSALLLSVLLIGAELTFDMGGAIATFMADPINRYIQLPARILLLLLNVMVCISFVLVLMSCACLARDLSVPELLIEKIGQFRASLYSSAAVLALSVFEIYMIFSWAANLDDAQHGELMLLTDSLAFSAGIVFSIFLAAVYLPVAFSQDYFLLRHINDLKKSNESFKLDEWMRFKGIEDFPLKIFSSYTAVFVPLVAGLLANLLRKFDLP